MKDLSGGKRNRLHLAKLVKSGGNLLLLDEPTNDLDVDTLRALEDAIVDFKGCAVVISHDRWFLDRIATHILASRGTARWCGTRGRIRRTRKICGGAKAWTQTSRIGSRTRSSCGRSVPLAAVLSIDSPGERGHVQLEEPA